MVFKSIVLSIVLSLFIVSSTKGQNKKVEDLMQYYRLKSDSIDIAIDNQARKVLNNQIRYIGHFNLSGRTESSNLVLSNDTIFVSKRDSIICFNGKTGEKYWAEKHKNRSNGEMLNTKSTLILTDYRAFKGISKRTGELVWTTKEYNIQFSKYNKQKDLIFLSNDTTKVGLDASSGEKKWEYKGNYFVLLDIEDNLLISRGQDTLFGISIDNQQIKWKYPEKYFESIYTCGDNLILRSYNDSIITLNKETGKLLSKKFKKYDSNLIDLTFTKKGLVKKIRGQKVVFLVSKKYDKPKWTYEIPSDESLTIPFNRSIGTDENNLYLSTEQGKLRAINLKNGKPLWEFDTYSRVTSNIVVGNGVLYFVNVSGQVIAIDTNLKNGVQKWTNLRDFE